ncbi:MAG: WYL domain-containing protein, partial [Anaerolineae bacterium]|nr:WYL domain-containing protein [Anaerolineae bacterium]
AEPQEMVPWIRGWGADVEVVGPEAVREQMRGEARRLAATYGWEVHRGVEDQTCREHQFFDDFFGG